MAGPDYILDVAGLKRREMEAGDKAPSSGLRGRPWLAIRWRCCGVYSRIYRNDAATAYEGKCPTCRRDLALRIGPAGTPHRFFEAY
jgi:hypothetical protein